MSLIILVWVSWSASILFLRALQKLSSSACFQLSPLSGGLWSSLQGGPMVNARAWWSDRQLISVSMMVFVSMPAFRTGLLANMRSMVVVWPLLSSLVGTLGSFTSLNEHLHSHSRVSLMCGSGAWTPLSQLGSLMFQSPAMMVGVEWEGMCSSSWSAIHSWAVPVVGLGDFWLYMLMRVMGGHDAPSLPMFRIM